MICIRVIWKYSNLRSTPTTASATYKWATLDEKNIRNIKNLFEKIKSKDVSHYILELGNQNGYFHEKKLILEHLREALAGIGAPQ